MLDALYAFLGKVLVWAALAYGAYYLFKQVSEEIDDPSAKGGRKKLSARQKKQAEAEAQRQWRESQSAKLSKAQKKKQKQKEKKQKLEADKKAAKKAVKKAKKQAWKQGKQAKRASGGGGDGPAPAKSSPRTSAAASQPAHGSLPPGMSPLQQGVPAEEQHAGQSQTTEQLPEWAFPVTKGGPPPPPPKPVPNTFAGRIGTAGSGRPNAAPKPTGGIKFRMASYKQKQKMQTQAPASPKQSKKAPAPKTRNKLEFPTLSAPKPAVVGPQAPFVPVKKRKAGKVAPAPAKIPVTTNPFESPPPSKPIISGSVSPDVVTVIMPEPSKKKTYLQQIREFSIALQKARLELPELPGKNPGDAKRKWKQGEVAIKLGLTPNDYAKFEAGKKYPPPALINKMNRVLGLPKGKGLPRVKKPPVKETQPIAEDYM